MLGAIIGDIVGSVYEFNNYRAKDFRRSFMPKPLVPTTRFAPWRLPTP